MENLRLYQAYDLKNIFNNTDLQITSIAANSKILIIGTQQGYLICHPLSGVISNIEGTKIERNSKKPIQQLEIVNDLNILICLTDGYVFVYSLAEDSFLSPIQQLTNTKGASLFAVNSTEPENLPSNVIALNTLVFLCVAVKRTLYIYSWKQTNGFIELYERDNSENAKGKKIEINLKDNPKALVWCRQSIFVAFKNEYIIVNVNGSKIDLFPTSSSKNTEPCLFRINNDYVAVSRDNQSIFINYKNEVETFKTLIWTEPALSIIYDEPFFIGISVSSNIEIQVLEPPKKLQSITLKELQKIRYICRSIPGLVIIASNTKIWSLTRIDVLKQREDLIKLKFYELALKLTEITNEKPIEKEKKIKQIQTVYAYDLFHKKRYFESMKVFIDSDTDPYLIIELYPRLLGKFTSDLKLNTIKADEQEDYKTSLLALIEYLTGIRPKIKLESASNKKVTNLLQIIDTTLLKCYLQTNDSYVAHLIRLRQCNLGESERILKSYGRLNELIILYETRAQHNKALELLKEHVNKPESPLKGYDRIIQYLQRLDEEYLSLIFDFADWVLKSNPEEGVRIFMEDVEEVETLPRTKILNFLEKNHKYLVTDYLEFIINNWNDDNPIFHNKLISCYMDKLKNLQTEGNINEIESMRIKLQEFLLNSTHYFCEPVLKLLPRDDLHEERAIILNKLGKYEEVMKIYLFTFQDEIRAVKYCNQIFDDPKIDCKNIFVIFLKLLLNENQKLDFQLVANILNKYSKKIPPIEVLKILPNNFPLQLLKNYLEVTMCQMKSSRYNLEIINGLLSAERLRFKEEKTLLRQKNVLLTESFLCPICNKKFTNQSTFVRYPNGDVVHYSCHESK